MSRRPRRHLTILVLAACLALVLAPMAGAISSGTIVFRGQRGGNSLIFTMSADGGGVKQWGPGIQPAISRNGKTIVYVKASADEGGFDLWARNADGRDLRRLTDERGTDSHPSLSPNGQRVVFIGDRPGSEGPNIFTIDIDGTHERQVTHGEDDYSSPSFSPDGKRIIFLATIGGEPEIKTMDSDGGDVTELDAASRGLRHLERPSYSPDGKRILFTANGRRFPQIFVCDAKDCGDRVSLTDADEESAEAAFSPSGNAIVFRRGGNLFRMNADGASVRQLTDLGPQDGSANNQGPSWGE